MESTNGEIRMALGLLGLLILAINYKRKNLSYALVAAWPTALLLMSMRPNWMFIDLPSSRVGNYTSYPLAILSAYAFYIIFQGKIFEKINLQKNPSFPLPEKLIRSAFLSLLAFIFAFGLADFSSGFRNKNNGDEVMRVFSASKYLSEKTAPEDKLLKDHNYLTADAWMKLFFMRGYKYPDSRGLFKRYEDPTKPREMCTLYMISNPASLEGKECFSQTGTNFIAINPRYDSAQFQRLDNFDQVYDNGYVMVYYRKQ